MHVPGPSKLATAWPHIPSGNISHQHTAFETAATKYHTLLLTTKILKPEYQNQNLETRIVSPRSRTYTSDTQNQQNLETKIRPWQWHRSAFQAQHLENCA